MADTVRSLRSKRLTTPLHPDAARFLDSTWEDAALVQDDILGTLAHVAVLEKARVLTATEAANLRSALVQLHQEAGSLTLQPDLEDVHMNVEALLTQRLGDLGKKVHTGRSRNDQVALDLRLWSRRATLALFEQVHRLATTLIALGLKHPEAVMPGHTHFQPAQPVLLSHALGAHAARFTRDLERIQHAYEHANVSPLGAGALAGTSHPIDPSLSAKLLGFAKPFTNSLDAVSDRDFLHELLFCQTLALNHVSSLAEEVVLFTHPTFGFFTLDDAHATGSSLMPQKRNPDVFEVARGHAATALGALIASLATTKALPLAYNRDLQEQKRLVLGVVPRGVLAIQVVTDAMEALTVNEGALKRATDVGYTDATELADYLVRKGVPFRQAHDEAAECVRLAIAAGVPLKDLTLARLRTVNPKIGADVFGFLGPGATVAAKTSPGGTTPVAALKALREIQGELAAHARFLRTETDRLLKVTQQLLESAKVVKSK